MLDVRSSNTISTQIQFKPPKKLSLKMVSLYLGGYSFLHGKIGYEEK